MTQRQHPFAHQKPRGRGRPTEFWPARKLRLINEWRKLRDAGATYDDAVTKLTERGFSKSTIERAVAAWNREQRGVARLLRMVAPGVRQRWDMTLADLISRHNLPLQ